MRLVFICPQLRGYGGTETVLTKVIRYLTNNSEFDVRVILTSKPDNKDWLDDIKQISTVDQIPHEKVFKAFKIFKILSCLDDKDKTIILGANIIPFAKRIRSFLHRKWKIISWIHYSLLNQKMFDPHNISYADEHWAISSSIQRQLIKIGIPSEKIKLVFNPIDEYHGKLNWPESFECNEINIVYVGRILFQGQKNLQELLQAIIGLRKSKINVTLTLYGNGPDVLVCQRFAKEKKINDCLSWRGWSPNVWGEIVNKLHPQALVLTSKFEGLPMVMLEAMAHGIPCVTSKFDGYDDVLQEQVNGLSYQLGDVNSLQTDLCLISQNRMKPLTIKQSIKKFYSKRYFENLLHILK